MKHNERVENIDEAVQKLFDVIIDGVHMTSESNSKSLDVIRMHLKKIQETACFLDTNIDLVRKEVAQEFKNAMETDTRSYIDEYGVMCGLVSSAKVSGKPCFDNFKAVVSFYFEEVAEVKEVERWKEWFEGKPAD